MTSYQQQHVDAFLDQISFWVDGYRQIGVCYVAIRTKEAVRLVYGKATLEPLSTDDTKASDFVFETEHILAGRVTLPLSKDQQLNQFVQNAGVGKLWVGPQELCLATRSTESFSLHHSAFYPYNLAEGPRMPALFVHGLSRHEVLTQIGDERHLDWEVKASQIPFESVDELTNLVGLPRLSRSSDATTIEILAQSPALLSDTSTLIDGTASIACHVAHGLKPKKIGIGYKVYRGEEIERLYLPGTKMDWAKNGTNIDGVVTVNTKQAARVDCFLSYDGKALHELTLLDRAQRANYRQAIHEQLDEDFTVLRECLSGNSRQRDTDFEQGITLLLHTLGFSAVRLGGHPKLQEGPDIIATTPGGNVCVIECTVGLLDNKDKLAKLIYRATKIKSRLAETGLADISVLPVIVTSLSREDVRGDIDKAAKHQIAVICKEELDGLFNKLSLPPHPDSLFRAARRYIPTERGGVGHEHFPFGSS